MHFRTAQLMHDRAELPTNVVPLNRHPASAERVYIEQKIAAKEREIAKLAGEIHMLNLELQSD